MKENMVSVIIPSYGRPNYLRRAIRSVVNQTYKNIEIIVVDDNDPLSENRLETEKAVSEFSDTADFHYIQNERNSERSFSRNNGVKHSSGEYIAFLDNDDEFLPNKIESQVKTIQEFGNDYIICYSGYQRMKNNRVMFTSGETREGDLLVEVLARDLPVHPGSNLLIRRAAFEQVGGFDETMSYNEDIDLLVRLLKIGKIAADRNIGLRVYLNEKGASFDYLGITQNFLEKEKQAIESLSGSDRKKVLKIIGLELIRFYAARGITGNSKLMHDYGVGCRDIVKYCLYLIRRKLTKKAYGFTLKYKI